MTRRISSWMTWAVLAAASLPWAGHLPGERWAAMGQAAGPDQPVASQHPRLQRLPGPQPQLPPGFPLTPQRAAYLDQVLQAWEGHSKKVKTFESDFTRWEYDEVFGQAGVPKYIDHGKLNYATPDRGMFRVTQTEKDGKTVDVEPDRAEHWVCNGKSIFQYDHVKRQVKEYKLPPELRGKAIQDGPLPFLFGAEAAKLKQRYFIRVIPAPPGRTGETWLEAYPRFQADAANFKRVEIILRNKDVMPIGLHTYLPNGKNHTAYKFWNTKVNAPNPWQLFQDDPFRGSTPFGWKKIVEAPPAQQAGRPPATGLRR